MAKPKDYIFLGLILVAHLGCNLQYEINTKMDKLSKIQGIEVSCSTVNFMLYSKSHSSILMQ